MQIRMHHGGLRRIIVSSGVGTASSSLKQPFGVFVCNHCSSMTPPDNVVFHGDFSRQPEVVFLSASHMTFCNSLDVDLQAWCACSRGFTLAHVLGPTPICSESRGCSGQAHVTWLSLNRVGLAFALWWNHVRCLACFAQRDAQGYLSFAWGGFIKSHEACRVQNVGGDRERCTFSPG